MPTSEHNRPFPSFKKSHFQNEAKCETFVVKMSFFCIIIKNHFHINGFALSLALKVRFFGTRKWPIHHSVFLFLSKVSVLAHFPEPLPRMRDILLRKLSSVWSYIFLPKQNGSICVEY